MFKLITCFLFLSLPAYAQSSAGGQYISGLPSASVLTGSELVPIVQNSQTVSTNISKIVNFAPATPPGGVSGQFQYNNAGVFGGIGGVANTILGYLTTSTPTYLALPSCSTSSSALNFTTGTSFSCNTSINAATLGGATFASPGNIGLTTPGQGTFSALTDTALSTAGVVTNNASGVLSTSTNSSLFSTLFKTVATTLGDMVYGGTSGTPTRLAGNTTTTPNFYTSTGTGSAAQAPTLTASTGSGSVVLGTSPSIATPTLTGTTTAAAISSSGVVNSTSAMELNGNPLYDEVNIRYFTTSGTDTPTTGTVQEYAECWGGGGGSGGAAGAGSGSSASGGGGGGGYSAKLITSPTSQTITIGAGGSAGSSGNNNGGTGGSTTFGSILTAGGGTGGGGGSSNAVAAATDGGAAGGGTASGGDINISGNNSQQGITFGAISQAIGGCGGGSYQFTQACSNQTPGLVLGAPGVNATTSNVAGIAGGSGLCKITEYISH